MYILTPNMKFLCLTLWLGGLYTHNSDTNNDGQSMIVYVLRLIKQMSQKLMLTHVEVFFGSSY